MPKIVIKEYDKTKAGTTGYANFSVLIPGFCGVANPTCFDENGVYECASQAEFIKNVGAKEYAKDVSEPAKGPVITKLPGKDEDYTKVSEEEHATYSSELYTRDEIAATSEGYLVKKIGTKYYKYTKSAGYDAQASYSRIESGNEGNDPVTGLIKHYGNQIAYELLGLGYTVLYKKMDEITPWGTVGKRGLDALDVDDFWSALKDKSLYDFRFIMTGSLDRYGNNIIPKLATFNNTATETGRGDCVALVDIPQTAYSKSNNQTVNIANIKDAASLISNADKYTAMFVPHVVYKFDNAIYENRTFPASFHYLACFAKSIENFAEWYAIAGYTRGVSAYSIADIGCKLGEAAVEALQPRKTSSNYKKAINIILKNREAHYLWGNRTAHDLDANELVASHFLNIRQLCCTLKKQIYVACRKFTFDPNSDTLWINFCNAITPTLEAMKADQGIKDYKIIKVATDLKATLKAKVRIVPIEAVEDFEISIFLEDSIGGNVEFSE